MKRNESDFVGFRWLGCYLSDVIHVFIIFLYDQGTFIRCNLLPHRHLAPIKGNPQIWTGSTSSAEILVKCHVSFWKKCLILISCLSFTKLLSMTYAKQNIQAAGSACSRLRVTWHGQKLAHHLRGNLRARWVFRDSFHDDWPHETKNLDPDVTMPSHRVSRCAWPWAL